MTQLQETIGAIKLPDAATYEVALDRLRNQARPAGSLGVLEDVSAKLAAIHGTRDVRLEHRVIVTCAGDHGIVAEGVSVFGRNRLTPPVSA